MKATLYRWDDVAQDNPIALLDRKRIEGEKIMLAKVTLHEGCHVATHTHENEQFACVISGKVRFRIGVDSSPDSYEVVLGGGDILHLPSNLPHGVDALEETHILDLLSPPGAMGVDSQGK